MSERFLARCCRNARLARPGISEAALAVRCGVSQAQISRRETGESPMSESSLESTARGLGISVRLLLLETAAPEVAATPEEQRRPDESFVMSAIVRNVLWKHDLTPSEAAALLKKNRRAVERWLAPSRVAPMREEVFDELAPAMGMTVAELVREGLLHEKPPPIDLAALRRRAKVAVSTGLTSTTEIARALDVVQSTISRFVLGDRPIGERRARELDTWLSAWEAEQVKVKPPTKPTRARAQAPTTEPPAAP